ncbi:PH domain-containing protein [Deinococcus misasensis]|uniref:PH domain-containing protein n=1 Tax=Deinococcus misasensis TaxID=392413 RepID=UPI000550749D|nr:PH domain-containing protein [Deinococcus misasensis]
MPIVPLEKFVANNIGAKERPQQVKHLYSILLPDENPVCGISGFFGDGADYGLLTLTNRRVILIAKGIFYGTRVEEIDLSKISSVEEKSAMVLATVTVHTSGNKLELKSITKEEARRFANTLREASAKSTMKESKPAAPPPQPDDLLDKLERLGKLKAQGLLTEEEFSQAKMKLLQ